MESHDPGRLFAHGLSGPRLTFGVFLTAAPAAAKHAQVSVADVIFADDAKRHKSMSLHGDPNNPRKRLRVAGARE